MSGLADTITRCNLHLKLDNDTEGYGNCFPNAIIQQCRRSEVKGWLMQKDPVKVIKSQHSLRRQVKNFALTFENTNLEKYKENYYQILNKTDKSWEEYWNEMGKEGVWVDTVFVQLTAWYIGLDIKILTTSSTPENPFIIVSGNIDASSIAVRGPPLLLGYYTNVHYQSLLP